MEPERIFDILENSAKNFPNKEDALACKENGEWKKYSFTTYYKKAQLLSYGLLATGLKKGDRVASISNNRPEWNFMDMALNQAGMVHVPIYPTISEEDYQYILNHCQPRLIIVSDKNLYQKLEPIASKVSSVIGIYSFNQIENVKNWKEILSLGEEKETEYKTVLDEIRKSIQSDDLATLIYTSGTTGNPKGVMLSHRNILSNIKGFSQVFSFNVSDSTLSFLPISHIFERTINYYFQKNGVSVYYAEGLGSISKNIKEVAPTVFITVPRVLESIYDRIIGIGKDLKGIKKQIFFWAVNLGMRYEFMRKNGWFYHFQLSIARQMIFAKWKKSLGNRIKIIVAGGAALQPRLIRIFNAAGIPLVEGYGMTENSPVIAASNYYKGEVMIGTVGPVLPGVQVKIAEDGEILVKGESVMKGYYLEPELTAEVFDSEGWFHTGDVGTLVDDKYLKITDRKKEMFKLSSGKYIAPQTIENKMKESFFIEQTMVVGENQKFASALILPNFSFLHNWCSLHHVRFRDNNDLINIPKVVERYQREVNEINNKLGLTEQIKRFRLITDEWSVKSGILSPTLKLKRKVLYERYKDILADIYSVQKNSHDD